MADPALRPPVLYGILGLPGIRFLQLLKFFKYVKPYKITLV